MSEGHGPQSGSTKPSGDAGGVHSIIQAEAASRLGLIWVLGAMGRFVKLWKSEESESLVVYDYGAEREQAGQLVISKSSGEITSRQSVPGYAPQESWFLYGMLARHKAECLFLEQQFPTETSIGA